jgi:hypothetical protein
MLPLVDGWTICHQIRLFEVDYLHVYVSRLRNKLEQDPRYPRYLLARRGGGGIQNQTCRSGRLGPYSRGAAARQEPIVGVDLNGNL